VFGCKAFSGSFLLFGNNGVILSPFIFRPSRFLFLLVIFQPYQIPPFIRGKVAPGKLMIDNPGKGGAPVRKAFFFCIELDASGRDNGGVYPRGK